MWRSAIPVVCSFYRQKPRRQHLCIVERLLDYRYQPRFTALPITGRLFRLPRLDHLLSALVGGNGCGVLPLPCRRVSSDTAEHRSQAYASLSLPQPKAYTINHCTASHAQKLFIPVRCGILRPSTTTGGHYEISSHRGMAERLHAIGPDHRQRACHQAAEIVVIEGDIDLPV